MSQEVVLLSQTVRSTVGTVGELLRMRRERRTVSSSSLKVLRDQVALLERQAHARNVAALTRTNIKELAETQRLIDSMDPSQETFWMCMEHLRQLSDELSYNLMAFSRA